MGLLSNRIARDDLKPGDHIYSWRKAYTYSHHGIYLSDEKVIHFTRGVCLETGTRTSSNMFIASSVPNHRGDNNPCPKCGDKPKHDGVISSCLDCFLAGGNIYLFEYGISRTFFVAKHRGGTCTTATSDPCNEVISRAEYLLLRNGFGAYDLLENNCEDFATYCKTGLVVMSKNEPSSGQAQSATVAAKALSPTVGVGLTGGVLAGTIVGGMLAGTVAYGRYCIGRLYSDIGMRSDVVKVPVNSLVSHIKVREGRSEDNKMSSYPCYELLV